MAGMKSAIKMTNFTIPEYLVLRFIVEEEVNTFTAAGRGESQGHANIRAFHDGDMS